MYFNAYRPYWPNGDYNTTKDTYQGDWGYTPKTVYWFKWEPLKWRILEECPTEAKLFCESIIDNQSYFWGDRDRVNSKNDSIWANNYEFSLIRQWLNTTFYETAFSELEQALIRTTLVDNSEKSANPHDYPKKVNNGVNKYAAAAQDTKDKIFLLSENEVSNSAYGFNNNSDTSDNLRKKAATAYAKCQGFAKETDKNRDRWLLRSPDVAGDNQIFVVNRNGNAYGNYDCDNTFGVVPALWIRLN